MRIYIVNKILLGTAAMLFAGAVNAAPITLVQYDTESSTTNPALSAFFADSSVSADDLAAGSGLTANNGSTWNWRSWDTASTDFDSAVAAGDFWSFGFDALADINLTTMDFRVDRSGTGPDDFELRVSVNGGSATTVQTHDFGDATSGVNFLDVDLSFLALSAGDSVDFIFAAFNSESAAGTFDLEAISGSGEDDGIVIYGEVAAVPLPAAVWLMLSAIAGLAGVARRKV